MYSLPRAQIREGISRNPQVRVPGPDPSPGVESDSSQREERHLGTDRSVVELTLHRTKLLRRVKKKQASDDFMINIPMLHTCASQPCASSSSSEISRRYASSITSGLMRRVRVSERKRRRIVPGSFVRTGAFPKQCLFFSYVR